MQISPLCLSLAFPSPPYSRLKHLPLLFGLTAVATILAIKICDSYNLETLSALKLKTIKFQKENLITPIIALIFFSIMALGPFSLGAFATVTFGISCGWRFEIDKTRRLQMMHADGMMLKNPSTQLALS